MTAREELTQIVEELKGLSHDAQISFLYVSIGAMKGTLDQTNINKKKVVNAYRIALDHVKEN